MTKRTVNAKVRAARSLRTPIALAKIELGKGAAEMLLAGGVSSDDPDLWRACPWSKRSASYMSNWIIRTDPLRKRVNDLLRASEYQC